MTHEELLEIGALISVENEKFRLIDAGKPNARFRLWMSTFGRVPGDAMRKAVQVQMQRSPYAPKVSDIIKILKEARDCSRLTAEEAFSEAQKLVSRFGVYGGSKARAFGERFCPEVWAAVARLGYREFCLSENPEALRAHFYRTYSASIEADSKRRELKSLSNEVKQLVGNLAEGLDLNTNTGRENQDDALNRNGFSNRKSGEALPLGAREPVALLQGGSDNASGS